ncbi:MAG: radical SAM family heme chaperone HemW [Pyrinomonadaceae bacterium]
MPAGLYLHIPFCKSRCSYCDFATDIYRDSAGVERYVEALCRELTAVVTRDTVVDSIYFGGGTPSILSPVQTGKILDVVNLTHDITPSAEVTMEMNPATVTPESLRGYRSHGVNRASFGVQTFNDQSLRLLARGHDAKDATVTFSMLRAEGFANVSFDLIAGLPSQTMDDWESNLDEAISLSPEHISLYLLEIHSGTPLAAQVKSGRQPVPDDELAAEMYEVMLDRLAAAGYEQYEISNFCRPGYESRHNSKYWALDPVYGFGVSAHSFDGYQRYSNERDTAKYVERIEDGSGAEDWRERVNLASEFAFLGLRMEAGIDLDDYEKRYGLRLETKFAQEFERLLSEGLIVLRDGRLQLSRRGKLFSNEVFSVFV